MMRFITFIASMALIVIAFVASMALIALIAFIVFMALTVISFIAFIAFMPLFAFPFINLHRPHRLQLVVENLDAPREHTHMRGKPTNGCLPPHPENGHEAS